MDPTRWSVGAAHAVWETEPVSLQAEATETGGREFRLIASGTATAAIKMAATAIESQRMEDRLDRIRTPCAVASTGEVSIEREFAVRLCDPSVPSTSLLPSIDRILSSRLSGFGAVRSEVSRYLTDGRASRSSLNKRSSSRSSGIGNLRWRDVVVRVISQLSAGTPPLHGRFETKLCGKTIAGTVQACPSSNCRAPEDNRCLRWTQAIPRESSRRSS